MINIKYYKYIRNCCVNLELIWLFYVWDIEIMVFEVWMGGSFNIFCLLLFVLFFLFNFIFFLFFGLSKIIFLFFILFFLFLILFFFLLLSVNLWKLLIRLWMGGIDLFLNVFFLVFKFNKKFVCFDDFWVFFFFLIVEEFVYFFWDFVWR